MKGGRENLRFPADTWDGKMSTVTADWGCLAGCCASHIQCCSFHCSAVKLC